MSNLAEVKLKLTATDYCISHIPVADSLLVHILPYSAPNVDLQADPANLCEKVYTRFTATNVSE
ncbi:MAG: hypothetical protein IPO21_10110 [Bacteroidales bacterium]|nr:hypothetical protein [Bacteroidales bacterium]